MPPASSLIEPAFHSQAGHLAEVAQVSREQRGVVGQGDAGYLHVQGAHLESRGFHSLEILQGIVIEWENLPFSDHFGASLHPFIDRASLPRW